jgi:hypothetical protein
VTTQLEIPFGGPQRVRRAAGPQATERLLLEDVEIALAKLGAEVLRRPVWVVVPSRSLRLHVLASLLARRSRALAGVDCRTHHSLAAQIVRSTAGSAVEGPDPCTLLARRFARAEPDLARSLEHLQNGYASVIASVRDLLDAGMEPAHQEALVEVLAAEGGTVATDLEVARAAALVRVAARTSAAMDELGLERSSTLLAAATARIRSGELDRPGAVFMYGYSDATGVATDFLQALFETLEARLYLDVPPDPVDPERADAGIAFSRRFQERLTGRVETIVEARAPRPRIAMFKALGAVAEVRRAGLAARELIEAGQRPERIAIVARDLGPYRTALRTHLRRLGVPFSGLAATGLPDPVAYRVEAILDLLQRREKAPTERWLEARNPESLEMPAFDLRLAFHVVGAGRLAEAAAVSLADDHPSAWLRLPVCHGLAVSATDDSDTGRRSVRRRRRVPTVDVDREARRAGALCHLLDSMLRPASIAARLEALRELVARHLGWPEGEVFGQLVVAEAERALAPLARDFELENDELLELLREGWNSVGASALGGEGGGVQVLDVIEARARTFDHLFVLGMNRGRFPRTVREDPVLPDALRHVLGRAGHGVLPDLTSKQDGFHEERYLFAQLLASSPEVTLSWQEVDEDHALQTPSPLVERLLAAESGRPESAERTIPTAHAPFTAGAATVDRRAPRDASEAAIIAALFGDSERRLFADTLAVALREAAEADAGSDQCDSLATLRTRVLDELDPARDRPRGAATQRRLGPYLGLVGPPTGPADPRASPEVPVTALEGMARCPWQLLVRRVLGVEALPDPLELLPSIEPRFVGTLVHAVLERIAAADRDGPAKGDLEALRAGPARRPDWPDDETLEHLVAAEARRLVRRQGIALAGFANVLARHAGLFLAAARDADWPGGRSRREIVAAEYPAALEWSSGEYRVTFRADRIDRKSGLTLTDYKTGSTAFGRQQAKLTPGLLAKAVATGDALQAPAYAWAAGGSEDRGRYLFLHPQFESGRTRELTVPAADERLRAAFSRALAATLEAWRHGTFFPRLEEAERAREPRACQLCDVSEACLRGDSGARGRLRSWIDRRDDPQGGGELPPETREAIFELWLLPAATRAKP